MQLSEHTVIWGTTFPNQEWPCPTGTVAACGAEVVPDNLLEWTDNHALARLVAAGQGAKRSTCEAVTGDCGEAPYILLGLLTYCYATGIYSSHEIELRSGHDAMVRHLCADVYPEARILRCFRRHNRESLQRSLQEVLQQIWTTRFNLKEPAPAQQQITWIPYSCAAEAEERINRAIQVDSGECDC